MTEKPSPGSEDLQPHRGPDHSAPYPVSRLGPPTDLVNLAREIAQAETMIDNRVNAQLEVIARQMRALQDEARRILEAARQDQTLHQAECSFTRRPGGCYHLYRKPDGRSYFSMLSPDDWRGSPPDEFLGSFRLEPDLSWTPAGQADQPRDHLARIQTLLHP